MKTIIFMTIIFFNLTNAFATPSREAGYSDALPAVAYGKDASGVLRAIKTDTSGVVQTA